MDLRIKFVTLGCAKNLVDTEKILGLLAEDNILPVSPEDSADMTIINTCGFIETARQEAFDNIEQAVEEKRRGKIRFIVLTGCLVQAWQDRLISRYPQIDALIGLAERNQIAGIIRKLASRKATTRGNRHGPLVRCSKFTGQVFNDQARLRITERSWAYLRISEGCSRRCSFCTIPSIRGPFRSRPIDDILQEAKELIRDGAVELNLIAQETTGFGRDHGGREKLADLLAALNTLGGLRWIRLLYTHPATITDDTIEALALLDKVVAYIDIPLQHINNRILHLMHRGIDRDQTEEVLNKLRRRIDNIVIRTTMLVGFPTETEAEFAELIGFIRQFRFDALGGFKYSREEHTPAAKLQPQIPEELKQERLDELMLAQQEIAFAKVKALIGLRRDCLITRELSLPETEYLQLDNNKRWYIGRHSGQAPEIDGLCYLHNPSGGDVSPGSILPVEFTASLQYDLLGIIIR